MAYQELMLPAGAPAQAQDLINGLIRPFLVDVHTMLRLPLDEPGLGGGCNFSAALILLSIVAGVSTQICRGGAYDSIDPKEQPGERFKRLLIDFFPWREEPETEGAIVGRPAAEILYDAYRNPLAHAAGAYDGPYLGTLKVAKSALTEEEIEAIECAEARPTKWGRPTLETDSRKKATRTMTVLTVKCFYWGVRKMIGSVVEGQWIGAPALTASSLVSVSSVSATATSAAAYIPVGTIGSAKK